MNYVSYHVPIHLETLCTGQGCFLPSGSVRAASQGGANFWRVRTTKAGPSGGHFRTGVFDECGHVLVPTKADDKGIKDELSRVAEYIRN